MNTLQLPVLIKPYAPLCPDGANAILAPAQFGLLDQLALNRYRTGFRSSAFHLQKIHFI
jgi:hypothetical protein